MLRLKPGQLVGISVPSQCLLFAPIDTAWQSRWQHKYEIKIIWLALGKDLASSASSGQKHFYKQTLSSPPPSDAVQLTSDGGHACIKHRLMAFSLRSKN